MSRKTFVAIIVAHFVAAFGIILWCVVKAGRTEAEEALPEM